jgi:carboxyl-terminal processing protease
MEEWYFFNDEPAQQQKYANLDINDYTSAEALLNFLRFDPGRFDRGFSFITTAAGDEQFFGEGQFVGFGFGSKFVDPPFNTDLRLTQIFACSPAAAANFQRGQRIPQINGRTIAEINLAEGVSASLGANTEGLTRTFSMRPSSGADFQASLAKALVTIDPVPLTTIFDIAGTKVGYVDFRTFVSTADGALEQAFENFEAQGISALVIDVRYNGGGLVSTAEFLADLIGGAIANNRVLSRKRFNSDKSALNSVELFQQRAGSLTLLQQIVFITTASSASSSELVINALLPHTVLTLVGGATFGKPVGQSAFGYCDNEFLLRPVTFEAVNALFEGQYYDGIQATCDVADELEFALGDPAEASLAAALSYIENGTCGAVAFKSKLAAPPLQYRDIPRAFGASAAERMLGAD